jgi:glycosyltransferase involved in cell wall biosynthesis
MAVYDGVKPDHLQAALESLVAQTLPPDEVLLVRDGPLRGELSAVLDRFAQLLPVRTLSLPEQSGSGPAKNAGLDAAAGTWVAIADADDVSLPDRLEVQLAAATDRSLDLLGAAMEEFDTDTLQVLGDRVFPTEHDEIVELMRSRNSINHPTVLMLRSAAVDAGGYRHLPLLEDYDLWVRMIGRGCRVGNTADPLVRFRGGRAAQRRRRNRGAAAAEWQLQQELVRSGLIGRWRMIANLVIRMAYRLVPMSISQAVYGRLFLRNQAHRRK